MLGTLIFIEITKKFQYKSSFPFRPEINIERNWVFAIFQVGYSLQNRKLTFSYPAVKSIFQ